MRHAVLLIATCAALGALAEPATAEAPAEQVEALTDDELDALDAPTADAGVQPAVVARPSIATEHDFDRRLLALPLLLVALLAWNVQWRAPTGRSP